MVQTLSDMQETHNKLKKNTYVLDL